MKTSEYVRKLVYLKRDLQLKINRIQGLADKTNNKKTKRKYFIMNQELNKELNKIKNKLDFICNLRMEMDYEMLHKKNK